MIRTLVGSVIFVSCMAIAWGSLDFFLKVPHTVIAVSALLAPFILPRHRSSASKYGTDQGRFLVLALLSTVGLGFLLPFFAARQLGAIAIHEKLQYLGVAIFLSGYIIRLLAAETVRMHQLITSGIYSMIRHPVYLGTILAVIGMFLVFPTWYGLIYVVLYTIILARRIQAEEKMLLKTFGPVFEEYCNKSFLLIPHVY